MPKIRYQIYRESPYKSYFLPSSFAKASEGQACFWLLILYL